jgi:hypothetical protein
MTYATGDPSALWTAGRDSIDYFFDAARRHLRDDRVIQRAADAGVVTKLNQTTVGVHVNSQSSLWPTYVSTAYDARMPYGIN